MTHSLHRQGTPENLANDYVVFAIAAQGINSHGSAPIFRRFCEIVEKYGPVNIGDMRTGNIFSVDLDTVRNSTKNNSIFHAVFTDPETVAKVLAELKQADLGPSIVLSGLFETLGECCCKAGVEQHTIEHSLGVWGRTDRLPAAGVVEISTMCGHGMVGFPLIEDLARQVRAERMSAHEAARVLAGRCHCGIFNPVRAEQLLGAMAASAE